VVAHTLPRKFGARAHQDDIPKLGHCFGDNFANTCPIQTNESDSRSQNNCKTNAVLGFLPSMVLENSRFSLTFVNSGSRAQGGVPKLCVVSQFHLFITTHLDFMVAIKAASVVIFVLFIFDQDATNGVDVTITRRTTMG
jgi:hypothetical protein